MILAEKNARDGGPMDYVRHVELTERIANLLPVVTDRLQRLSRGIGEEVGLTRIQVQMLDYLDRWGDSTIGTLKGALRRAQSSISELTDRLEDKGLVRRRLGDDRRTSVVGLTADGRRWARIRHNRQEEALSHLLTSFEVQDKEALRDALTAILEASERLTGAN